MKKNKIGLMGENFASFVLFFKGYKTLKRRYKNKLGEIDLVLKKNDTIIFCEVKTRINLLLNLTNTENIVSLKQRQRLKRSGAYFMSKNNYFDKFSYRFDLIIINSFFRLPLHIKNVFW